MRRGNHSAPRAVLSRMKAYLKSQSLRASDQAWLVVDKDQWTEDQLTEPHAWSKGSDNFGFALSNPSFEYWLLLHFEDGEGLASARECSDRLRRHCPRFDKGVVDLALTVSDARIRAAIRRAKRRDTPPCGDWPRALGGTTVYRLVDQMVSPGAP
ncbi:MAG: RloB family protein [Acidiferrobacter sp.]